MLICLLWIMVALSADTPVQPTPTDELSIRVEPAARWPARARLPALPTPPLPITTSGRATIDGRLNEPKWDSKPGPPLIPFDTAEKEPSAKLVALSTPEGVAIGIWGDPAKPGWVTTLTIDPKGTRTEWLEVSIKDGTPSWKTCRPSPIISEGPGTPPWPTSAMPCEPLEPKISQAVVGVDGIEILFAWQDLPAPALSTMQVGWFSKGPNGHGGTWSAGRSATANPPTGRKLDLPDLPRARLKYDLENGGATLHVETTRDEHAGTWVWLATQSGIPTNAGVMQIIQGPNKAGSGSATLRDLPYEGAILATRGLNTPLAPAAVVFLPRKFYQAAPINPVHDGTLVVAMHLLDPYPDVPYRFLASDGQVLAEGVVSLPAGRSDVAFTIPNQWPDTVQVSLGDFLDPHTIVIRAGTTRRRLGHP